MLLNGEAGCRSASENTSLLLTSPEILKELAEVPVFILILHRRLTLWKQNLTLFSEEYRAFFNVTKTNSSSYRYEGISKFLL